MTLPATLPLSMSQIATELGLALPLSLGHAWAISLAGKAALPVSFIDLLGKTAQFTGNLDTNNGSLISFSSAPFFGGQLNTCSQDQFGNLTLGFTVAPNWTGNIELTNNSSGASAVLSKSGGSWTKSGASGQIISTRPGVNNFTVQPSN